MLLMMSLWDVFICQWLQSKWKPLNNQHYGACLTCPTYYCLCSWHLSRTFFQKSHHIKMINHNPVHYFSITSAISVPSWTRVFLFFAVQPERKWRTLLNWKTEGRHHYNHRALKQVLATVCHMLLDTIKGTTYKLKEGACWNLNPAPAAPVWGGTPWKLTSKVLQRILYRLVPQWKPPPDEHNIQMSNPGPINPRKIPPDNHLKKN